MSVVTPIDAWQAAAIIAKAVTYGGGLAAAGGVLFLRIFRAHLHRDERRRTTRLVLWLAVVGVLASAGRVMITAGTLSGTMAGMTDWTLVGIVLDTGEGWSSGIRILGLAMAGAIALDAFRAGGIAVLGAGLVALSFALTGHASAVGFAPWPQILATIHILAVAYWIGALGPLRMLTRTADLPRAGMIMTRFGNIAAYGVGGLVMAGLGLLWLMVETPEALIGSEYGRLVVIKLGLVAVLLGLAATNKLRLTPRLEAEDDAALAALRRSITMEIAAVTLILLVTATFTTITGAPVMG